MESQRSAFWNGSEKTKSNKNNKTKKEELIPVRTTNFDSRQVIQLYDEVEVRDLNIYSEVM